MRRPTVTGTLIAVNVAVFLGAVLTGTHAALIERFGFVGALVAGGDVGRAIVSGFLHTDAAHLLYNMLFLGVFGAACEEELGPWRTVLVYAAGLFAGELFFALLFPAASAVGSSGAVFALLMAGILVEPGRPVHPRVPFPVSILGVVYLLPAAANAFSLADNVANIAHVGGAVAGGVLAFRWEPRKAREGLWVAVALALLVLALGTV